MSSSCFFIECLWLWIPGGLNPPCAQEGHTAWFFWMNTWQCALLFTLAAAMLQDCSDSHKKNIWKYYGTGWFKLPMKFLKDKEIRSLVSWFCILFPILMSRSNMSWWIICIAFTVCVQNSWILWLSLLAMCTKVSRSLGQYPQAVFITHKKKDGWVELKDAGC